MTTLAFSVVQLLATLVCIIAFSDGLLGDYLLRIMRWGQRCKIFMHLELGSKVTEEEK